ncbi:uncharacterized protein [Chironomus tepperi]|uniref:uncharacterized protein n=1 Tax=Chironomus tepperi TaxID=113505 RepID=UPI00391EFAEE
MKFSWSIFAVLVVVCHMTLALPSLRLKRDDKASLDPTNVAEPSDDVNRDRRAFNPEASFQSKNAVLGFVFGKIDQFIDAKTRLIDNLDRTNVEKNRQLGIEAPQPVPNFQSLISGIITPKITAASQAFASLSSGVLGSSAGSSSGSSSGGNGNSDSDSNGAGGSAGGLSNILSSVLRLSGPILSASLGGGSSGGGLAGGSDDTTPDPDDDFASSGSAHVVGTASRTAINRFSPTKPPLRTTTDDTPDFDRKVVSIDIPDELFGGSFTTITNVSKLVGDLMMNTSRRAAQFLWIFKPLFGNALTIEIPDPTTTTTEEPERL